MVNRITNLKDVSFDEVYNIVKKDHETNVDTIANARKIEVIDAGNVKMGNNNYTISPLAFSILFQKSGLNPNTILDSEASDQTKYDLLNEHLTNQTRYTKCFVRMKDYGTDKKHIRGFFTPSYTVFDNYDVLTTLRDNVDLSDFKVKRFSLNEEAMHLDFLMKKGTFSIGKTMDGKPDNHGIGFGEHNSEIGLFALETLGFIWRLICTNGMVRHINEQKSTQRHFGLTSKIFGENLVSVVNNSIEQNKRSLELLKTAKEKQFVFDAEKFAERLVALRRSSKGVITTDIEPLISDSYGIERVISGDNDFTLVQAITRTARDLEDKTKAHELEMFAGQMLN